VFNYRVKNPTKPRQQRALQDAHGYSQMTKV